MQIKDHIRAAAFLLLHRAAVPEDNRHDFLLLQGQLRKFLVYS